MEEYPEELRTPPLTLASIVGYPELHSLISTHLLSCQPPINTFALPHFSKINLFNNKSHHPSTTLLTGIFKRDWLLKHRSQIPSVLAPIFPSQHVFGDPSHWLQLCSDLDSIKTVIRGRNIKLAVVIVQTNAHDEVSDDRMIALRKRAEVDAKYVITLNPNDNSELKQSLNSLANIFSELASAYYREEGRRIKQRIEKKNVSSPELIVRYCFKVAVYAEFRSDWAEALKFYEEAYHTLREIVGVTTRLPAVQRLVEIKSISEQLHFKISTLLLHSGKVTEAVTWFRQHKNAYKRLVGAPEATFIHWEWMSRQFLVFGELLETSAVTTQSFSPVISASKPLSDWEYYPAYYYQLAAHYLSEKRAALELAISMSETSSEIDCVADSVVPSVYVGQFARLLEQGDNVEMLSITDEEYTRYAVSEGRRFRDSLEIIALQKKAYESYSSMKIERMGSYCGFQMGKEYFTEGDIDNAKQIFDSIASLYRKEGWVTLLWDVLGYLRECSRKNGTIKEFLEYSLEMAALPIKSDIGVQRDTGPAGPANLLQRETIQKEVFDLVSEASGLATNEKLSNFKFTGGESLQLEVDLVSPLRLVMFASVAFHEQAIKPGTSTLITVSLLCHLPITVEIDQLEIQFNQSDCNIFIANAQKPQLVEVSGIQQHRVETVPSLSLESNKWLRLTYDIKSDQSGKLDCLVVLAKIGRHFTICCRAESPASLESLPLWTLEDSVQTVPLKDPVLVLSGQKSTQVEEQDPRVDLHLDASGPALVGEIFMVPVTVLSKGHDVYSGELKINLVDVKGGVLFSPRDSEPYSTDSHHVELLGISGPEGEDDSQLDPDKIKKIQQSFGLISIPFLKNGDSWTCKLEIKWHRPKPIMLYVSLGYTPYRDESNTQMVHVHKNLQIEGQTAIVLNHHFLMPFRRDPLLLSRNKQALESDQSQTLPLNQKTVLIVSAKNCTELPLRLKSISIEADDDVGERTCSIQHANVELSEPALIVPGQEFKKVFSVSSDLNISKLRLGTMVLRWRRDLGVGEKSASAATSSWVMMKQKLPDTNVELPPLIVNLECPPYAILGDPFTYYIRILNQTQLLQEVKYSLEDAQSFVLSGHHNDTVHVLPKSEHILSYKLVPLASGIQQLPRFSMTSVRYSAAYQPSNPSNSVFVFPSKPQFKNAASTNFRVESVAAIE
ncbi:putative tetratricopeptide-like helical domain, immunoglobulin-like, Foie gras liver health family 1 [Lupinus albus]|uniref:Putative tetratricopeptide-like helical domain, immunoglobulin-like, Foie gras liver health family 1 n=1 Tax=Lupinus albus TaxID=3870 RepID=A0A6A4NZE6_LUPAL|nr:putative tetratricopeptide-like helical domain, immunoglobulin-like, Foie gras liver health family 1 [Lupinus albus]